MKEPTVTKPAWRYAEKYAERQMRDTPDEKLVARLAYINGYNEARRRTRREFDARLKGLRAALEQSPCMCVLPYTPGAKRLLCARCTALEGK